MSAPYAPGVRFQVLGQLQADRDGIPLDLGGRKSRLLLAALLLERGRAVPVGRLVELLWGDDAPDSAEAGLHSYVSKLRRVLEPNRPPGAAPGVLVTRDAGYALLVADADVDAHTFAERAAEAAAALQAGRWEEAGEAARAARQLWRGPLLPEFSDHPFTVGEARRLEALLSGCREASVVAALARDAVPTALAEAESWIDAAPDDERAQWLLVLSLHRAGRSSEALERLRSYRDRLGEQTGLDVGRPLASLQSAVLAQDPALEVWPLTGPAAAPPASRSPQRAAAPPAVASGALLGRDDEIALLHEVLEASSASAQWVVLSGTAGIGKTSLAATVADGAARRVWSRCPDDTVPAWWPLRQVVRQLGEDPDVLLVPPADTDADAARFVVYERVAWLLLEARPAEGALTVVVDDVQWADDSSLSCLAYLADALGDAHLVFVLTLRDDEAPRPGVQHLLATLARRQRTCRIPVPPLSAPAVAGVVERVTGERVSPSDAALLALRTGGNPLFVGEYARLPEADRRDGRVPVAAQELLQRRLARLPDRVVEVLRTAAVVGEDFDLETLAAATGTTLPQLAELLDAATEAQVVVAGRAGGTAYGFAHALLRDAVLSVLTVPRRQLLHATVASVLEGRHDAEALARRAGHLLAAGPVVRPEQVRAACVEAARDAAGRLEHAVAAQWWESALRVSRDAADRLQLELAAVSALSCAGRPDRAVERVDAAFTSALAAGRPGSVAPLLDALVHVQDGWIWTVLGEPRPPLLDRLLAALPAVQAPAERVPLLGAVVTGLHLFTRVEERLPYALEAQRLAEQVEDADLRRSACAGVLKALIQLPHRVELAWTTLEQLRSCLPDEPGRLTVFASQTRADLLLLAGDVRRSLEEHERTTALSDALGLAGFRSQARWAATRYAQWSGDHELAEELAERAFHLHRQTGVQYAGGGYAQSLLSLRRLQGRAHEVDEDLLELTRGCNLELWQAVRAHERGEAAAALRWVEAVPRETKHWWGMLSNQVLLAHAVCDVALVDRAQEALDDLEPAAGMVATVGHFGTVGPVDLAAGRLLLLLGRRAEAQELLQRARALAVREGGRPFVERADQLLAGAR